MRAPNDPEHSETQFVPSHSDNTRRTYYSRGSHVQDKSIESYHERQLIQSRSPERRKAYSSDNRQSYPTDRRAASPESSRDSYYRTASETYIPNGGRPYPAGPLTCPSCRVVNLNSRKNCEYCQARLPRSEEEEALIGVGAGVGGVALGAAGAILVGATIISSIARPP